MPESTNTPPARSDDASVLARLKPVWTGSLHAMDSDKNPAGGRVDFYGNRENGESFNLAQSFEWQDGPVTPENPPNGVTVEALIDACVERLEFYNAAGGGKFRCRENSLAITALQEARNWLMQRRLDRLEWGVLNKHEE